MTESRESKLRQVAVLGSTGSIGRSALRVLERHAARFGVLALTANRRADELRAQVSRHHPRLAVLASGSGEAARASEGSDGGAHGGTVWRSGREALIEAATLPDADVVLNAVVGAAGLEASIAALRAGKRLALANKESLVVGGPLVLAARDEGGGELVPVDSEHSAILQCLAGCPASEVRRLVLTASGGPFRERDRESLVDVRPRDALRHPTWSMGAKVTVDSATLVNKALEVIEAHYLFGVPYDRIDTVIHPQSIIHSMVEFRDGSVLAQMGHPTMELPILYALSYPERVDDRPPGFDPVSAGPLTFEAVDPDRFPAFGLGVQAGCEGGTAPAVFNASNEVAVAAFLDGALPFLGIADVISRVLGSHRTAPVTDLEAVLEADRWARERARAIIAGT